MRRKHFRLLGEGGAGGKVDNLGKSKRSLVKAGLTVPGGHYIGTGAFQAFVELNHIDSVWNDDDWDLPPTDEINEANQELLKWMEVGRPYILRSSAVSESGGTGIEVSEFFVPTGDKERDLDDIWQIEIQIYAGEFSLSAAEWRRKHQAGIGIAILVQAVCGQPIVGTDRQKYFAPYLAGTAYTLSQGSPKIVFTRGIGKGVVDEGGIECRLDSDFEAIVEQVEDSSYWALNLATSEVETIEVEPDVEPVIDYAEFLSEIFATLDNLSEHGCFYLEWALDSKGINIVQCDPYEDKTSEHIEFQPDDGMYRFVSSNDIVNSGVKRCSTVVYAGTHGWNEETVDCLEELNRALTDYLLILPTQAFSRLTSSLSLAFRSRDLRIQYSHFSNAVAVVEIKPEPSDDSDKDVVALQLGIWVPTPPKHEGKTGGEHFKNVCKRDDILFIGAVFERDRLYQIPGAQALAFGILGWKLPTVVVNNTADDIGSIYFAKEVDDPEYSLADMDRFTDQIAELADGLADTYLGRHAESILNAVPIGNPEDLADPFRVCNERRNCPGLLELIESLRIITTECFSSLSQRPALLGYLKLYLTKLEARK